MNSEGICNPNTAKKSAGRTYALSFGFSAALRVFAAQRMRTLLAVLGVFLGSLLLTLIIHVLGSVSLLIEEQGAGLGAHVATITADRPAFSRNEDKKLTLPDGNGSLESAQDKTGMPSEKEDESTDERTHPQPAATLTVEDMGAALREVPYLRAGVPFTLFKGHVQFGRMASSCQIMGVGQDFFSLRRLGITQGRVFLEEEAGEKALVCVLGHALAVRLFGDPALAPGAYIRIERSSVRVTGVLEQKGADSGGTNMDELVLLPVTTVMQRFSTQDHVSGIYLEMQNRKAIPAVSAALRGLLRYRHHIAGNQTDDFTISFAEQVDEMLASALDLITVLGFIGAGISFAIGALGIFSIMTLMVYARRTEIGIRRAVGAPRRLILQQFLCEAGLMAGAGGLCGVLVTLLFNTVLSASGLLPEYFNMFLSAAICMLSVLCGLLAGLHPAMKAARMDILHALKA